MARSLTIQHDEKPATSTLLNAFLLLAFGWLAMTAIVTAISEPVTAAPAIIDAQ